MTTSRCRIAAAVTLSALALAGALPLRAELAVSGGAIEVPSGQTITYIDTVQGAPGPEGLTVRFRFLAPAIARDTGTITPEVAQGDMLALCLTFALPRIPNIGPQPQQIIISLSDRPVEFGIADEAATQFFDAFSIADGDCILELF